MSTSTTTEFAEAVHESIMWRCFHDCGCPVLEQRPNEWRGYDYDFAGARLRFTQEDPDADAVTLHLFGEAPARVLLSSMELRGVRAEHVGRAALVLRKGTA